MKSMLPSTTGAVRRSALTTMHVGELPQVLGGGLHRARAVEGHERSQVRGEKPGVAALAAAGVQTRLARQVRQVDVTEVHTGELGVLVTDVVERIPFVSEALEGSARRLVDRTVARQVEVTRGRSGTRGRARSSTSAWAWLAGVQRRAAQRASEQLEHLVRRHTSPTPRRANWEPA